MTGYKIYLTKSHEVALLISEANRVKVGEEKLYGTSSGKVCQDCGPRACTMAKDIFIAYRSTGT